MDESTQKAYSPVMITDIPYTLPSSGTKAGKSTRASFKVLNIYDTVLGCLMAKLAFARISKALDVSIDSSFCSFTLLGYGNQYQFNRNRVQQSDLVIVSKYENEKFPKVLLSWLDTWMNVPTDGQKGILGVFALEEWESLEGLEAYRLLKSKSGNNQVRFHGMAFPRNAIRQPDRLQDLESEPPTREFVEFASQCLDGSVA